MKSFDDDDDDIGGDFDFFSGVFLLGNVKFLRFRSFRFWERIGVPLFFVSFSFSREEEARGVFLLEEGLIPNSHSNLVKSKSSLTLK